ncbi:senescence marker protein-30 (SMP-30) [Sphingopyxis lindanitolerans]|uniref:Senescence marker protein-30 (SMP-30) n=1 Tax=Sphingopyxis lindanitolerans TaxID=2054227 RepID=A0A2S8B8T9_9SPHN|nr:SMP-30/gluconolactonase/LRE family protein [Sphingopyxis lindanitolerans]PQM28834.1 senescence marker protein-30 (SMP-30) [Sphingopyxis lindanitolerans]
MPVEIDLLEAGVTGLGESPLWDHRNMRLWWIDSAADSLHSSNAEGGEQAEWMLGQPIGSIGLAKGGLIVALSDGFYRFDLESGRVDPVAHPKMAADTRLNDGKADRAGRFLAASMRTGEAVGGAELFQLDANGAVRTLEVGIGIGNAICFSPAGDRLYFADSLDGLLRRYDYDSESGAIGPRRDLVDCRDHGSGADGATVDAEGRIWVALVMAQAVACYAPDGVLLRSIPVPLPYPSCPAFGGPKLDILYLTSIANSGNRLVANHPDAGRITVIRGLDVPGIAEGIYR